MGREAQLRTDLLIRLLAVVVAALVAGGCAALPKGGRPAAMPGVRDVAPVAGPGRRLPTVHVVRRGDTLYAIAWRYGMDYRTLARRNRIGPPYVIHPGQRLALHGTPKPRAGAAPDRRPASRDPAPAPKAAAPSPRPKPAAPARPAASVRGWSWPAKGPLLGRFGKGGGAGIDIGGRRGQPVVAARDGRVVYNGSGLVGYGHLVILKHSRRLLTAYAHNDRTLVKEGQAVRAGQKIAEMGSTGADRVKLHFEVRQDGKPVNPLRYLRR